MDENPYGVISSDIEMASSTKRISKRLCSESSDTDSKKQAQNNQKKLRQKSQKVPKSNINESQQGRDKEIISGSSRLYHQHRRKTLEKP